MRIVRPLSVALALVLLASAAGAAPPPASPPSPAFEPPAQSPSNTVPAQTALRNGASVVRLSLSVEPPAMSPSQLAAAELAGCLTPPAGPPLPVGDTAVPRLDSVADQRTAAVEVNSRTNAAGTAPAAPGDLTLFRNAALPSAVQNNTGGSNESPVVANSGAVVFMAGYWWGAISADGGQTFHYFDPRTILPAAGAGLCCYQLVVYDPSRDIFIWTLVSAGLGSGGTVTNLFRVATARPFDALQGIWNIYDFASATNTMWSLADLCLTNDYAYYLTDRIPAYGVTPNDTFIFRFPLDPMATGASFGYSFLEWGGNVNWKCAQGGREVLYIGAHNSTTQVRIMQWPENSGSLSWADINLSAAWSEAAKVCPTPDGKDWCGSNDGRIRAGWVSRGLVGFMWNSAPAGPMTQPYVEALRVQVVTGTVYYDRPNIWSPSYAFQYPTAAPNARGDVGLVVYNSSASRYPAIDVAVDDDYARDLGLVTPAWQVMYVAQGTRGPAVSSWSSYFSVQPFAPTGLGWVASGQLIATCSGYECVDTRFMLFGRERDLRSVQRYYNQIFGTLMPMVTRSN